MVGSAAAPEASQPCGREGQDPAHCEIKWPADVCDRHSHRARLESGRRGSLDFRTPGPDRANAIRDGVLDRQRIKHSTLVADNARVHNLKQRPADWFDRNLLLLEAVWSGVNVLTGSVRITEISTSSRPALDHLGSYIAIRAELVRQKFWRGHMSCE